MKYITIQITFLLGLLAFSGLKLQAQSQLKSTLDELAFQYRYDVRQRMIAKKIPGADWVYMVYDNRDRPVMTQDGEQRKTNKWSFTKYDPLNRPIITGIYTHSTLLDQAGMSAQISTTTFSETYTGDAATHGYSDNVFPSLTGAEVLSVAYYDDYSFKTMLNDATFDYDHTQLPEAGTLKGQEQQQSIHTTSLITGTKTKVLNENTWLWNVSYYDDKARPIQTASTNHRGGIDKTTSVYDFTGKVLRNKTTHTIGPNPITITRRLDYDHVGRLLSTWHSVNGAAEVLLTANEYNALGQLVTKKLHSPDGTSFKQLVDYRYNIRGWLEKVNDPVAPEASDLFSMDLHYNNPSSNGGAAQYNGNISEITWATAGMDEQSYGYDYDAMNRILEARYFNRHKPAENGRYNEKTGATSSRPAYDLNGNILNLVRAGKKTALQGNIDDLRYYYRGNQLAMVNDAVADNSNEEGFKELNEETFIASDTARDEYAYDANGNMKRDRNKGITSITYNHLNLPVRVSKSPTEYLVYTYDAGGRKLRQQVFGTTPKTTDYNNEFVYENNALQFILHEEGRLVPDNTAGAPRPWEYQYFLKDHLGNTRVTFSEKRTTDEYRATLENDTQNAEQATFSNYGNRSNFSPFNHTIPGTYSQLLNAGNNSKVGLARSFEVNPGDIIDLEAYAKYEAPGSSPAGSTSLLVSLISAFSLGTGVTPIDGPQAQSAFNTVFPGGGPWITSDKWEDAVAPKAYLNYILFDEDFVLADFGFDQVGPQGATDHEHLNLHVKVEQKGYLYIYLSNEQTVQTNVYFDDLKIVHHTGVEQSDDYYPFGLSYNSYTTENTISQDYKYNGKEEQNELGLGWLDYGARMYMPDIGRWSSIDPHAEKYEIVTPYNYAFNNPMFFVDPSGKDNIIYLLIIKGMAEEEVKRIVALANKYLEGLGLATRVQVYDEKVNGVFDECNLDETDNWAVIGNDRDQVADRAISITNDDDYKADLKAWKENKQNMYEGDPEVSNNSNKGKGIAVDHVNDNIAQYRGDPNEGSAIEMIHGAGHSGNPSDHTKVGVMANGKYLNESYMNYRTKDILNCGYNEEYIDRMMERYGTMPKQDNYKKNRKQKTSD